MSPKITGLNCFRSIIACFQPVFGPGDFYFSQSTESAELILYCKQWGNIGKIIFREGHLAASQFRFEPPLAVIPDEPLKYETMLREEVLGLRGRLADLFGQKDVFQAILSDALYEKRVQRQQEFKAWLSSSLQIFGYHNLPFGPVLDSSAKFNEQFDFPIKGTPAQFGVMLRQFALTLASKGHQRLMCQIVLPGGRKDTGSIPPDANPIEAKISLDKNRLSIHAHILPSEGTLLRIRMTGERTLWELWDAIRDELEKLGWFSLPAIPEVTASTTPQAVTSTEAQTQPANPTAEIWLTIPDIGPNREILRYWHKGLTCEQIAVRVSLSGKTVLNRINKLRKDYGTEVAPYRKSNYIKDSKKKPS
jgi:hypothetical protein